MAKKTETKETKIEVPEDAERFTATLKASEAKKYKYLSEHEFNNVKYRVASILSSGVEVSIEFVKVM